MAGTYKVNGDKLTGLTVYSTLPIGTVIQSFTNSEVGFLPCDHSEYNQTDFPELYAKLQSIPQCQSANAGKFYVPDLRESGLVGVGESDNEDIASHDTYTVGEFKDDQFQGHHHNLYTGKNDQYSYHGDGNQIAHIGKESNITSFDNKVKEPITDGTNGTPRTGTTTHGKQTGVYYLIKAVDYVSLPQNAIDDTRTTTGNAWSASKTNTQIEAIKEYVANYNKLSDYEEVDASEFGNSEATAYEAEYDGFFFIDCLDGSGSKYSYMQVKTVEGTIRRFFALAGGGGKQSYSMPVNKGDKIWYEARSNAIAYYFRYYKNR